MSLDVLIASLLGACVKMQKKVSIIKEKRKSMKEMPRDDLILIAMKTKYEIPEIQTKLRN